MVAVRSRSLRALSSTPVTVTVWGRFQFWVVKVRAPETVATVSS